MADLRIDGDWIIPDGELELHFVRSPGPGGQHVNQVATKAELRFCLAASTALSNAQKRRLVESFPSHATLDGMFIVTSDRFRSQRRNQEDARTKLAEKLARIRRPRPPRVPTRATLASRRRRVSEKRARGELKRQRGGGDED